MNQQTTLGLNKTGVMQHPEHEEQLRKATEQMDIDEHKAEEALDIPRKSWIKEAEPVGSVPMPPSFKGTLKMGAQMLKGVRPQTLIDKLGERLAFERTGVRLYDALITKCEASGEQIDIETLKHFRGEEAKHFKMLKEVMEKLGADPTAVTPSADVMAVASLGLTQVMSDPRTTASQALEAILIAELADNDCWEILVQLAGDAGMEEEQRMFQQALLEEEEHLKGIRSIVQSMMKRESHLLQ